jgi:predicted RNase H-like HicB family nuclease
MSRYLIIVEPTHTGYSAYSPDLPGCVSTGKTREEIARNMKEAVEFHLEGLREEGYAIPPPRSEPAYCEV